MIQYRMVTQEKLARNQKEVLLVQCGDDYVIGAGVYSGGEVLTEYQRTIRYGDKEFEDTEMKERRKELNELAERLHKEKKVKGGTKSGRGI